MKTMMDRRVADYMTQTVVSVHRDEDLTQAIGVMDQHDLSVLPVVDDGGQVCGILSNSDLIEITYKLQCDIAVLPHVSENVRNYLINVLEEDNCDVQVSSAMTGNVETIRDDVSLAHAAQKLIACDVHHLPVVDANRFPIGIIATTDIVRAVADASAMWANAADMGRWEDDGGQNVGDDYAWLPVADRIPIEKRPTKE